MRNRRPNFAAIAVTLAALVLTISSASAKEIQLGGIRLGQHALRVMEVFGQPDGVVKGAGQAQAQPAGAGGAGAAGAGGPGMGGLGMGGPGMGGPGAGGGMGAGMGGGAGMMGGAGGAGGGMMGGAGGAGGGMMGGMMGGAGGAGAAAGGASARDSGTAGSANWFDSSQIPDWAAPVWVPLIEDESLYIYRRGANVIGFVMDRDGYVIAIALAGRKCGWARTALWNPHKAIKLGDSYDTLLARYGYPDLQRSFDPIDRPFTGATTLAAAEAAFGGITNATRNMILSYNRNENIEFVLQDLKIVRIHIWEPDMRDPQERVAGTAAGGMAGGAGGAGGPGGGAGMGGPGMGGGMGPR